MKVKSLSCVRLLVTPWTAAYQASPSMGFSRQEYWSGVPLPSLKMPYSLYLFKVYNSVIFSMFMRMCNQCYCSVAQSCPTLCDPMDCSTSGFPVLHCLRSLLKLMSIESVMPSNLLILCHPLLLLPSNFLSNRVFLNESAFASEDKVLKLQLQH